MDDLNLLLLNLPDSPTRTGTSVTRDTTPDLSFLLGSLDVSWFLTNENLGSDHDLILITIKNHNYNAQLGVARLTDWDAFRKAISSKPVDPSQPLSAWIDDLIQTVDATTKTVATTYHTPDVDPKLLGLWEARRSLTKRWKRQRHNRKLRLRIAALNQQATEYATNLSKENWLQLCDSLQGTLTTKRTWHLLRHLIDPQSNRSESHRALTRILHCFNGSSEDLMRSLETKYLHTARNFTPPPYTGQPNPDLDRDFQLYELRTSLSECNKKSTPGLDHVTYRLLANLGDDSMEHLLEHINAHWKSGKLPPQWKTAEIRFIPKPNKSPHLDNLRPISLTSCVGKLVERMLLRRLQPYLEAKDIIPNTMYGFRKHLCTQDILLRIKEEILIPASRNSPRAILALDLKEPSITSLILPSSPVSTKRAAAYVLILTFPIFSPTDRRF